MDTRNLVDEFKGKPNEEIVEILDTRRSLLEIAIENIERDFNFGTIVRNANAMNVQQVHIIGKRKYNRRGAMCTDKYLKITYWTNPRDFINDQINRGRIVVAIENNVPQAKPLADMNFEEETTLVFGSEGNGISPGLLGSCHDVREIESFGSTRSVNVGVASGIAMYQWAKQWLLGRGK